MSNSSGPGWVGPQRAITHYLTVVGADRDEDGRFIIGPPGRGGVFMFLGIDDPNNDAVIDSETVFYRNGRPCPLAAGLRSTSSGLGVYVIA